MADSLINLLKTRTVLIRAGTSIGTGTLIAPGMVLTCAHVVRKENEDKKSIEVLLPDLTQPGKFIWKEDAEEVYLSEIYEEQSDLEDTIAETELEMLTKEYPDVSVIKIKRKNHDIIALPKHDKASKSLINGQFLAFGFQKRDRDLGRNIPQAVSLNYSGEEVDGAIVKLMFSNGLIQPGMSGAALMERETGEIVGIVHMTRSSNDNLGAYVIPIEKIWRVIKKWEIDEKNTLLSTLNSKSHILKVKRQYRKVYPKFPMLRKYGVNVLMFSIIIFLLVWWVYFHFGQILDSGIVPVIFAVISIVSALLGSWFGKSVSAETSGIKDNVGKRLLGKIGNFILGIMVIIAICLWTFSSTTWVYGNLENSEVPITFFYGKDFNKSKRDTLKPSGKIYFFNLHFKLNGDSMKIVPDGRGTVDISIKPYSNLKEELYYPSDFKLEPVILIRFPSLLLTRMNKYSIEIKTQNNEPIQIDSLTNKGSLMLGLREMTITREHEIDWKQYLEGAMPTEDIKDIVSNWKIFKRLEKIDLNINDTIFIKLIRKSNGNTVINNFFVISKDDNDKLLNKESQ